MAAEGTGMAAKVPAGHPVDVLRRENAALEGLLDQAEAALEAGDAVALQGLLVRLKAIRTFYGKKENILMPMLLRHGVRGPNDVMWGVDDEIKAEVAALAREMEPESFAALCERVAAVLARMREMVYKEENIFFPLCLEHLTREEWLDAYRDLPEMGYVFIEDASRWLEGDVELELRAKAAAAADDGLPDGIVRFAGGELTVAQLKALFDALPMDLTFIDEDEINRFFTNKGKVFSRPLSALGRSTYECHPERVKPMVRQLVADFKSGKRDSMEVWTPNPERPVRVRYLAVRDEAGGYLGTLEVVEDMTGVAERLRG